MTVVVRRWDGERPHYSSNVTCSCSLLYNVMCKELPFPFNNPGTFSVSLEITILKDREGSQFDLKAAWNFFWSPRCWYYFMSSDLSWNKYIKLGMKYINLYLVLISNGKVEFSLVTATLIITCRYFSVQQRVPNHYIVNFCTCPEWADIEILYNTSFCTVFHITTFEFQRL